MIFDSFKCTLAAVEFLYLFAMHKHVLSAIQIRFNLQICWKIPHPALKTIDDTWFCNYWNHAIEETSPFSKKLRRRYNRSIRLRKPEIRLRHPRAPGFAKLMTLPRRCVFALIIDAWSSRHGTSDSGLRILSADGKNREKSCPGGSRRLPARHFRGIFGAARGIFPKLLKIIARKARPYRVRCVHFVRNPARARKSTAGTRRKGHKRLVCAPAPPEARFFFTMMARNTRWRRFSATKFFVRMVLKMRRRFETCSRLRYRLLHPRIVRIPRRRCTAKALFVVAWYEIRIGAFSCPCTAGWTCVVWERETFDRAILFFPTYDIILSAYELSFLVPFHVLCSLHRTTLDWLTLHATIFFF